MSLYDQRGVSAQKDEVHRAIANLDQGLYPHAFCKIYPDRLGGSEDWVNLMHTDGAGTKSILAYLYWKETGDISVWRGIAQDAIAMNLDDLLCVGIFDKILFSSSIDRNKKRIPGEVLEALIQGTQAFFEELSAFGIHILYAGGETADVGDLVRTVVVNGTMSCRWPKSRIISNERIAPGDQIIGLASFGQTDYETEYNSGIGSNGLTSARHDCLEPAYGIRYPESFDESLGNGLAYVGRHRLTDPLPSNYAGTGEPQSAAAASRTIGQLLLSPTRTYAPLMKVLLEQFPDRIRGLVHCSGGGQTKCLKYLPGDFRVVKDGLFDPPPIFHLIQEGSGAARREMYQVFNMGHRLEIFARPEDCPELMRVAAEFSVESRIVGRVEDSDTRELILRWGQESIRYESL